jgi:Putative transposase
LCAKDSVNICNAASLPTALPAVSARSTGFLCKWLLDGRDAEDMLGCQYSAFSVDAGACIEAHDRAGLERLLRYCARPPFSMDRLRKEGAELVYRCTKQHSEPTSAVPWWTR